MIWAAVQVSMLSMGVIFLVLSILIVVIRILDALIPYQAPPAPPPKKSAPPAGGDDDHIAAIHAALAHHLGKNPQDLAISRIQPH